MGSKILFLSFVFFLFIFALFLTSCKAQNLQVEDIRFVTFEDNEMSEDISRDKLIYFLIPSIEGLRNKKGKINVGIKVEIAELGYAKWYLGEEFVSDSTSIDSVYFPLNDEQLLGKGKYTIKITVRDNLARKEVAKEKILELI